MARPAGDGARRPRIGIVANLDRSWGGIYQYAVTMVEALPALGLDADIVVFTYEGESLPPELAALPVEQVPLRRVAGPLGELWRAMSARLSPGARQVVASAAARVFSAGGGSAQAGTAQVPAPGDGWPGVDVGWAAFFARHDIDLLLYTADSELCYRTGVAYVAAVHDIQHRLQPRFPEVSADGEWERREHRIGLTVEHATVVLVDSEVGREDVLDCYADRGVTPDGVHVLPFLPAVRDTARPTAERIDETHERLGLTEGYLFYPAQFWPHKNHRRIVEALGLLAERGMRVHVAFAGTHSGALREQTHAEVLEAAARLGVSDLVHDLGYVADDDMPALYAGATALVMPTYFGPTNIPVLEAWAFRCPVVTSDIRGVRDQAGDAALLVDPDSAESIAAAIERLVTDPALRSALAEKGAARLAAYTAEEYHARLRAAIECALAKPRVLPARTDGDAR